MYSWLHIDRTPLLSVLNITNNVMITQSFLNDLGSLFPTYCHFDLKINKLTSHVAAGHLNSSLNGEENIGVNRNLSFLKLKVIDENEAEGKNSDCTDGNSKAVEKYLPKTEHQVFLPIPEQ